MYMCVCVRVLIEEKKKKQNLCQEETNAQTKTFTTI